MKKAVILSAARSGSNYLLGKLQSHRGVYFHGEIFHPKNPNGLRCLKPLEESTGESAKAMRDRDPLEFLDLVYSLAGPAVQVAGFKLFLNHSDVVLDHVINNPEYRIVLLERENRLAVYSSAAIGRETGVWLQAKSGSVVETNTSKVPFEPEVFDRYRSWADTAFGDVRRRLEGRENVHSLTYIEAQEIRPVADVLRAMNLKGSFKIRISTHKQNPGPLLDRFTNPDEVVAHLERHGLTHWLTE